MTTRIPEMTGQEGVYYTAGGGYVDVDSSFDELSSDHKTFATEASAKSWADGDTVTISVWAAVGQWEIWDATWDATNEHLEVSVLQDSKGSAIANGTAVEVLATVAGSSLVASEGTVADEWILLETYDLDGTSALVEPYIPATAREAKVELSDLVIQSPGTLFIRDYLDGVMHVLSNIKYGAHSFINGNSTHKYLTSTGSLFRFHTSSVGQTNVSGEIFIYNLASQVQIDMVGDLVYQETTSSKMVKFSMAASRPTTGKDVTQLHIRAYDLSGGGAGNRNMTGRIVVSYKE